MEEQIQYECNPPEKQKKDIKSFMKLTFLRPEKVIHKTYNKFNVPVVDNETLFRKAKAMGLPIKG
jgi:hypothetical protein